MLVDALPQPKGLRIDLPDMVNASNGYDGNNRMSTSERCLLFGVGAAGGFILVALLMRAGADVTYVGSSRI